VKISVENFRLAPRPQPCHHKSETPPRARSGVSDQIFQPINTLKGDALKGRRMSTRKKPNSQELRRRAALWSYEVGMEAVALGAFITPLPRHRSNPPIAGHEKLSTQDPEQIHAWAQERPGCNWAIDPAKSGFQIVDPDVPKWKQDEKTGEWYWAEKVGATTLGKLEARIGKLPPTFTVVTPSGGRHLYFKGTHRFAIDGYGKDCDSPKYLVAPGCRVKYGPDAQLREYKVISDPFQHIEDRPQALHDWLHGDRPPIEPDPEPVPRVAGKTVAVAEPAGKAEFEAEYTAEEFEAALNALDPCKFIQPPDQPEPTKPFMDLLFCCTHASVCDDFDAAAEIFATWGSRDPEYANRAGDTEERFKKHRHRRNLTGPKIAMVGTFNKILRDHGVSEELIRPRQTSAEEDFAGVPVDPDLLEAADKPSELQALASEWIWVATLKRFFRRDDPSLVLDKDAFNDMYRALAKNGTVTDRLHRGKAGDLFKKPARVVYRPTQAEFLNEGRDWNLWRPSPIVAAPGDTLLWNAHVAYLFPDQEQRDHLLNWLAGVLQRQQVKPMHALLMIGRTQGTGKSFVLRVLAKLIGDSNWKALTQDILASGFTGWAARTKLVTVEELRAVGKNELAKKLHPWITQSEMTVNEKNLPVFQLEQQIAFAFMSNAADAIPVDTSDRRYLVLETKATPHPEPGYYKRLYVDLLNDEAALGAILFELLSRGLGAYDISGRAPETAAKYELKKATASDLVKWIRERDGEPPFSLRTTTMREIEAELPPAMRGRTGVTIKALEDLGYKPFAQQIRPRGDRHSDKIRVWLRPEFAATKPSMAEVRFIYNEEHPTGRRREADTDLSFLGIGDDDATVH
jgi:hypothetical protein